ncbi:GrpB family protein [Actinophytocola sp. KF-1]
MDEEQLRAITVGELTPYETKVVIADYDPAWPDWFEWDRARIAEALGPIALSIDHAGSTSVPGLPAKPIIDILLQVDDSADEDAYVPALEAAGYTLRVREPEWLEHRLLRRRDEPHDVNLHVFSPRHAAEEIHRMLAFRDWLRTNDADRDLYASTKRALSTREWRYVQDYADAKSEVVQQILTRALA